ncbi:MAG: hypothetical protein Q8N63_06155 [Nanoarchaeota archaeon]|nr:hypothetical protein [Nanoarchaeota archaeon]
MNKKTVFIVSLLMAIFLIGNVLAITAKIGNGVMVLRGETGDEIEKYVLVINDNNVSVDIKLTASGDLKDYITIKDTEFTLKPGEEKKAYFTIEVGKEGKTESKINVQFTPVNGKNGVGLSSTITVIANGENLDEDIDDPNVDENTGAGSDNNSSTRAASTSVTTNIIIENSNKNMIAFGTTMILALIFIVALIFYYARFKKKPEGNENMAIEEENIAIKKEITAEEENIATKKTKLKKRVKKRA